jgi:lysophospholipase L1-like esterase
MQNRIGSVLIACRAAVRRGAVLLAGVAALIVAAITPQPAWAETGGDPECPRSASAMKGDEALRAMAEDGDFKDGVQILTIGSSSTEGVGASSPARTYPHQLELTLEGLFRGTEVAVENAGVRGETADATVARLEDALRRAAKPDLVIWQVGTNDAVRGGDEARFQALLERGVNAAQEAGVDLILLDQQFYPTIPDLQRYERYVRMVSSVADRAKVGLFSRYQMMRDWVRSDPDALAGMLSQDRFHMGDRGYGCLAKALGHEIASAIEAPLARAGLVARARRIEAPVRQVAKRS